MSKPLILACIILAITFSACGGSSDKSATATTAEKPAAEVRAGYGDPPHSPEFLAALKSVDYPEKIQLEKDYMLIGADTAVFPTQLALGKVYLFSGDGGGKSYRLKVTRINLTSLDYEFQLYRLGKPPYNESGRANLGAMFFLADEVDEDDETNEAYGAAEYTRNAGNCWFNIRLGHEPDHNGQLRAEVRMGCEKDNPDLTIEDSPTLRER